MKYLLRLLIFLLKNLVLVLIVGALLVIAFSFSMDAAHVYIIANDGMEKRTAVVLGVEEPVELTKFFTVSCLESDTLLQLQTYTDYTIRAYDYRGEVEWLWAWPWDSVAEVTLSQHVPVIDGELPVSKQNDVQRATPGKILPPAWDDAKYKLTLVKVEGRWKISELEFIEYVEPLATRAPSLTAAPTPSPSSATLVPPIATAPPSVEPSPTSQAEE